MCLPPLLKHVQRPEETVTRKRPVTHSSESYASHSYELWTNFLKNISPTDSLELASDDYKARPLLYVPPAAGAGPHPLALKQARTWEVHHRESMSIQLHWHPGEHSLPSQVWLRNALQPVSVPAPPHTRCPRCAPSAGRQRRRVPLGVSLSYSHHTVFSLWLSFYFSPFNRSPPRVTARASAGSAAYSVVRCFFSSKPALPPPPLSNVPIKAATYLPSSCPKPQLKPQPRAYTNVQRVKKYVFTGCLKEASSKGTISVAAPPARAGPPSRFSSSTLGQRAGVLPPTLPPPTRERRDL